MLSESVHETLMHVWKTLQPLECPVALLGSAAMTMWGHARFTKDVDLLFSGARKDLDDVVRELQRNRVVPRSYPPTTPLVGVDLVQCDYQLPDSYVRIQVDLQFATEDYQMTAVERRIPKVLPPGTEEVDVVACEDLILLKLMAGRAIDMADAAFVLRFNAQDIDVEYLLRWGQKQKVWRELKLIWDEAFPGLAPPNLPPKDEESE